MNDLFAVGRSVLALCGPIIMFSALACARMDARGGPAGFLLLAGESGGGSGGGSESVTTGSFAPNTGTPDTSFGGTGSVAYGNAAGGGGNEAANDVDIDPAGNVIVTGWSQGATNQELVVWKLNPDGSMFSSFNNFSPGISLYDSGGQDTGVAGVLHGGRVLATGESNAGNRDLLLLGFDANTGAITLGPVTHHDAAGGGSDDWAGAMAVDAGGTIYIGGDSVNGTADADMVVWSYTPAGALNAAFNGGFSVYDRGIGSDDARAITVDGAGSVILAGNTNNGANNDLTVLRYKANGSLDPGFGTAGVVIRDSGFNELVRAVQLDSTGRVLVGGSVHNGVDDDALIWRLRQDGSVDTSFGGGVGFVTHPGHAGTGEQRVYSMLVDGGGNILACGTSSNGTDMDIIVWRFLDDGTPDTSFGGGNGFIIATNISGGGSNGNDTCFSLRFDAGGRILVAGTYDSLPGAGVNNDVVVFRFN